MVPASLPASSLTDASVTLRPYQSFFQQGTSFSPYNATYQNDVQNIQTDHSLLPNNNGLFDVATSRSFYNNETIPYFPDTQQQQQQQQQYEPSTYFENPQLFSANFHLHFLIILISFQLNLPVRLLIQALFQLQTYTISQQIISQVKLISRPSNPKRSYFRSTIVLSNSMISWPW